MGVAISSAILNSSLAQDLPARVPSDVVQSVLGSSEYVRHGCPPEYVEFVLDCYLDALRMIWYVMTAMCGVGFCLSLLVKPAPVLKTDQKKQSDANENQQNDSKVETPPATFIDHETHPDHVEEGVIAIDMQPTKNQIASHHHHDDGDNLNKRN